MKKIKTKLKNNIKKIKMLFKKKEKVILKKIEKKQE